MSRHKWVVTYRRYGCRTKWSFFNSYWLAWLSADLAEKNGWKVNGPRPIGAKRPKSDMKRSVHKKAEPYKRKCHIAGKAWSWRATTRILFIRTPSNHVTITIPMSEFTGLSPDDLDRARWKGYYHRVAGLGGGDIKDFILKHNLKDAPERTIRKIKEHGKRKKKSRVTLRRTRNFA